MATKKPAKAATTIRTFSSVFGQNKVREIDSRIMQAQKKYIARVQKAQSNAKDFVITH